MIDRAVVEFGRVDVMVNNAAIPGTDMWIWDQTLENWNATLTVDVTAAMLCTREVLRRSMLERGSGVIINVSSGAAYLAVPRKSHYMTAKAALVAFSKAVAAEVGPKGIRCNCLVPGSVDTELWRNWVTRTAAENNVDYETRRSEVVSSTALQDISTPEDISNLALFLASDESRTITGQAILCNAGQYMLG